MFEVYCNKVQIYRPPYQCMYYFYLPLDTASLLWQLSLQTLTVCSKHKLQVSSFVLQSLLFTSLLAAEAGVQGQDVLRYVHWYIGFCRKHNVEEWVQAQRGWVSSKQNSLILQTAGNRLLMRLLCILGVVTVKVICL